MPVEVQCPIASSLCEFPSYWDWLWCPGLSPVLVSIALPFAFHTWCFPFALICHRIPIVFLLYGRRIATHSVDPSLTHFLGEFPGSGTRCCGPRGGAAGRMEQKTRSKFLPWLGENLGPWHLAAADGATRLPRTPPFSCLLRHAGDYSRTILTPNLQVTLHYIKICPGPKADWPCLHLGNARCGMKICRAW